MSLLLCVFLAPLLQLSAGEGVWSGLVNSPTEDFDYQCPNGSVVVGLASLFRTAQLDRQWEYQCGAGLDNLANVSASCTLQPPIEAVGDDIDFLCPDDSYIGGFHSQFLSSVFDRLWSPYCCQRPFAALVDCINPTTGWENGIRDTLNFSAPVGHVVAGFTSFFFNRDRRWRYTTCAVEVNCTDPGTPASSQRTGDSFLFTDSVSYTCNHGYYQSEGPEDGVRTCQQDGLWSGVPPVCTACAAIENCEDVRCTNSSDHTCHRCHSHRGEALGEAAYRNLITECLPLCSWLQGFCYPGSCLDGLSSCNCSSGFAGPDCLNITVPPDLLSCSLTLWTPSQQLEVDCSSSEPSPSSFFTNILPLELRADWSADFLGPFPPPPAYVQDAEVGVASSNIHTFLFRAANLQDPVSMVTLPCSDPAPSPSPDSPTVMSVCTSLANSAHLASHTFLHGDTFLAEATVLNGGYLDIRNLDTPTTSRHYYSGTPTVGVVKFVLDVNPPVHCSLTPTSPCIVGQSLLDIGPGITPERELLVSWGGWGDEPAGIVSYSVDVYRMIEVGGTLEETLPMVTGVVVNNTGDLGYRWSANLTEGAFSVVARALDLAGNVRYSRRLVLTDSLSQLLVDNTTSLRVDSAVPQTGFLWVNSTTTPVIISGRGHFYNTHLRYQNLLAPVANFTPAIETDYDYPLDTGPYPRSGTPNALGVTQLFYQITTDRVGGASLTSEPSVFPHSVSDLSLEGVAVETGDLSDGDSVRVWFQAADYVDHTATDSVLFHVDSSPPLLEDLWLEWNGVTQLALHGTESLLDLRIQFTVSDPHSGVLSLQFMIGLEPGTSNVASGQTPVQRVAALNCSTPLCVCSSLENCSLTDYSFSPLTSHFSPSSHLTLHDTEYYITIVATNHAHLTSSLTHKITTDITPPLTGVVMDASPGSHDLDYTINTSLVGWWADFFDRETSILTFLYHFGSECVNESHFTYPLPEGSVVGETTDTRATWTAPGTGMYYVTVAAVNHALQPSHPVCSDGITIDESPPIVSNIIIPTAVETPDLIYISTDSHINISWSASDDVSIRGYHVAAINEGAWLEGQSPNFTSAGRLPFFSLADSDLLSNGNTFYIIVKATDHALHESELTFGPVRVDITPPVVSGNVTVETSTDHVTITWQNDSFTDSESGIQSLDFSLGDSAYGSQVLNFSPISSTASSPLCGSEHCLSLPTSSLPLLSGHTYHLTLRARNHAGLDSYLATEEFIFIHGPPTGGRVVDLDPHVLGPSEESCISLHDSDTDLILDSDLLTVRWEGFDHTHLNVTFSIGLGSIPGTDDVIPFSWVGTETRHSFTNLTLQSGEHYYVTVVASNDYGTNTASSDGFTYLSGLHSDISMTTVVDGNEEGRDIDYQYSQTSLGAQWACPPSLLPYLSHYLWAVLRRDSESHNLTLVWGYENVGSETWATGAGMELRHGEVYVSGVQICLSTVVPTCMAPIYSDGVRVLDRPVASHIHATYTPLDWDPVFSTSSSGRLDLVWSPFQDPRMAYYEWAIGTGEPGYELLTRWSQVEWYETSLSVSLNVTVSLHKRNTVTLRGFNAAGLISMTATELLWNVDGETTPQDLVPRSKLIVYDIPDSGVRVPHSTDWRQLEYSEWDPIGMELDYTNSARSLSAAWPDLRYTSYNYSVSTTPTFTTCTPPSSGLACGTTIANSVTIPDLALEDGVRYYICVQTRRPFAIHPSPSSPFTLTACSNGVTVDLSPPSGSCVQIQPLAPVWESDIASGGMASGSGLGDLVPFHSQCVWNGSQFQSSSSDLHIVWSPFRDVEWNGNAVHASGIAYYEYGVGSQPGEDDVIPFTEVGVVNDVIITGLRLQSGHTYYATVRATDFTGQWSDVTSPGVTVDSTPPTGPSHFNLVNTDSTYSTLPLVLDEESGVIETRVALGSGPDSSDLLEWTPATYGNGIQTYIEEAGITDGQLLFASLQVWNGARLSATFSSLGHTHDSTPPHPGTVYDVLPSSGNVSHDQDHTHSLSEIWGKWSEWSDPHTPIVEYFWAIGTAESANDVQDFLSVGVATVARRKGLSLTPGGKYYITVRGCNLIGLCSEASSNGITVDVTPPIPGWVRDGLRGEDLLYQSSRSFISSHWSGFHDSESSLQSYLVWAGTSPGDDSLLSPSPLPPSSSSLLHPIPSPLPTNITVYVTLVAISNAGEQTSVTSDGVFIDDTPPIVSNITVDTSWVGSVSTTTQFSNTALRATWNSDGRVSPVRSNTWSIVSYPGTFIPRDSENVNNRNSGTASGLALGDGCQYSVSVTSCSGAGLCTTAETHTSVLVDGSPPVDGFFAVATDSTFPRSAAVADGMTWRNRARAGDSRITLSFYGFSDAHSEVSEYWVEIGTRFGGSDLTQGAVQMTSPTQDPVTGSNTATVPTVGHVTINETLYLSLWAVNGVGLPSRRVVGSFIVEEEEGEGDRGQLRHIRSSRCPLETALGHCTCAARGDLCPLPLTNNMVLWEEVSAVDVPEEQRVGVVNMSPQQMAGDVLFTSMTDKLLGSWVVPVSSPYQRLEWTVGLIGGVAGSGLFDASVDQIWREVGNSSSAIFSVNPFHPLLHGETYVVYVRGWFNYTHFVVFESGGITVDVNGPKTVPGGRIREGGSGTEIDHTADQTSINVEWNGVFIQELSAVHSSLQIGIGDLPGLDNVLSFFPVPNPPIFTLSSIFSHNRRYFTTLRITSPLSVSVDTISDGFLVDTTAPQVGVAFDGFGYRDEIAQSNNDSLSGRWTGFHDAESGIHHYEVAMSDSPEPTENLEYEDVGIGLQWTMSGLELIHGVRYYFHVAAVNRAGVWSSVVSTNGITVDMTRPEHRQCVWELVNITSFEPLSSGTSPCNESLTYGEEEGLSLVPYSPSFSPLSGCLSQLLWGPLSLSFPTSPSSLHTLSFWLARQPGDSGCGHQSPLGLRIQGPDHLEEVILVHTRNEDSLHRWSRFQVQFTPTGLNSILTLSPLSSKYSLLIDDIALSRCDSVVSVPFDDVINNNSSVFRVGQEHVSGRWTRFRASWELGEQGEEGVREYMWAIGTTEGGEQLQPFISTGSTPYGVSRYLSTFHTEAVYLSLVAWNHAGDETVVYGGPYSVDFTPPELRDGGGVLDGVGGVDLEYQSTTDLQSDWSDVVDPESGIQECSFVIGTAAGRSDLHPHTPTSDTNSSVTLPPVPHGTLAITTVTCRNGAGLQSTFSSNGVTILQTPPTNQSAYLAVSSPLTTEYGSHDSHVPSTNVTLRWGGFAEPAGNPLHYEVCLGEGEEESCVMVGDARQLIVDGVGVASEEEMISVTAVNLAGLRSVPLRGRVVFQISPPNDTGAAINITWVDDTTLHFDWSDKFTSSSPLTFELSIGTMMGSGIIRKWVELETDHTHHTVSDSRLSWSQDYFLSLVAVSRSGLHTSAVVMVDGVPLNT